MADYILCIDEPVRPYMLQPDRIRIYSIEELCYYLQKNLLSLEAEVFEEGLISWISSALGRSALASRLREKKNYQQTPIELAFEIMRDSALYSAAEMEVYAGMARRLSDKTPSERQKFFADQMLEKGEERRALYMYLELLSEENVNRMTEELHGEIRMRVGDIYARHLLFSEALEQYEKAWELIHSKKAKELFDTLKNIVETLTEYPPQTS